MAKKEAMKSIEDESLDSDIGGEVAKAKAKLAFERKRKEFDTQIEELAGKAADFYERYGEDDWRTSLLVNFLDMSLQMQSILEIVTAFDMVSDILSNVLSLMHQSLEISSGKMLQVHAPTVSGLKQWWQTRVAMRNNRKTVKALVRQMASCIDLVAQTTGMYEELSESISAMMERMNAKRLKRRAKKAKKAGASGSMTSASGKGMEMVKGILRDRGVKTPPAPATPSTPTDGSGSTKGTGVDDIV